MEKHQGSSFHFKWHEILLFVVDLMQFLKLHRSILQVHLGSGIQIVVMTAWQPPKTPIIDSGILQRDPKPNQSQRVIIEECRVLMDFDFPTDLRGFQNSHRLDYHRIGYMQIFTDIRNIFFKSDHLKQFVMLMQSMSNLINRIYLRYCQFSILISSLLKEEADFIRRVKKVLLHLLISGLTGKDAEPISRWLIVHYELVNLLDGFLAGGLTKEIRDQAIAIFFE